MAAISKVTVSPSLESIQEISILTNNFTAEYGNRSGAVINIVTKSGTNRFHGVAFESLRNEDLNANSWANNYTGLPRAYLSLQLLRRQSRRSGEKEQDFLLL